MSSQLTNKAYTISKHALEGVVVRRSGAKTIAVKVVRVARHPIYEKAIKKTVVYLAHDPDDAAQLGEKVIIRESRPMSKRKRWTVIKKLRG